MNAPAMFAQPTPVDGNENAPPDYASPEVAAAAAADTEDQQVSAAAVVERMRLKSRRKAQEDVEKEEATRRRLVARRASEVAIKRTRWLWAPNDEGRIPLGELTLIVGRGGVGKSIVLCTMAAWITIGDMRGEFDGTPRDVLYVANEDSLERTVVPRLIAAGADLSRVHFLTAEFGDEETPIGFPQDCDRIAEVAQEVGAACIFLDPLSSNLKIENRNDSAQVRRVVERIRAMCEQTDIAAVGLAHVRKASSTNLMDALLGSSELGNVCRSAMGVATDPDEDDTVILSQEKSNLGKTSLASYKYQIVSDSIRNPATGELLTVPVLKFTGKTDKTVSDILSDGVMQASGPSSVKDCAEWLRSFLESEGPTERKAVLMAARKELYQDHTVKRAAAKLKVRSVDQGVYPRKVAWSLPTVTE